MERSNPRRFDRHIDKLSVVFVAIAGVALLGEHLSTRGWAGIILIAMGAALVAVA